MFVLAYDSLRGSARTLDGEWGKVMDMYADGTIVARDTEMVDLVRMGLAEVQVASNWTA